MIIQRLSNIQPEMSKFNALYYPQSAMFQIFTSVFRVPHFQQKQTTKQNKSKTAHKESKNSTSQRIKATR